ncbi:MAG: hypothetical protein IPJ88_16400 [Myxococcales bacterium]|nr:MAG: hypothetical protein IPJ88_16400 [Myxococcales bacterium]
MEALRSQLQATYPDRHNKFQFTMPAGTDVMLPHFPPTPIDPYSDISNVARPSTGTYRFGSSSNPALSVDHTISMAMAPNLQWQDADQSGATKELNFLPALTTVDLISSPEYFVPATVAYDPCMTNGNCSTMLLEQIYNASMTMTVYYYSITRTGDNLYKIPLRQVGSTYTNAAPGTATTHGFGYFDYQGRLVDFEP